MQGISLLETRGIDSTSAPGVEGGEQIASADEPLTLEDNSASLALQLPAKRDGLARRLRDAVLRPVFVLLTTQSVIVALLVCLAAVMTAQQASQIIIDRFSAISAALKRF